MRYFSHVDAYTFTHPTRCTSKQRQPLVCPVLACVISCKRRQDLERHVQSAHLPYWVFCSSSGCQWRGDRLDKFQSHLSTHDNGQSLPAEEQEYQIYNVKMVLSWIRDSSGDDAISIAQKFAVDLVKERALELGKQQWLDDPWGRSERQH